MAASGSGEMRWGLPAAWRRRQASSEVVTAVIGGSMHRRGGACAGVNGERTGGVEVDGGRVEGFCDVGMVRVFFFLF